MPNHASEVTWNLAEAVPKRLGMYFGPLDWRGVLKCIDIAIHSLCSCLYDPHDSKRRTQVLFHDHAFFTMRVDGQCIDIMIEYWPKEADIIAERLAAFPKMPTASPFFADWEPEALVAISDSIKLVHSHANGETVYFAKGDIKGNQAAFRDDDPYHAISLSFELNAAIDASDLDLRVLLGFEIRALSRWGGLVTRTTNGFSGSVDDAAALFQRPTGYRNV